MLSKEEFVRRILDGLRPTPKKASKARRRPLRSAQTMSSAATTPPRRPRLPPPADTRFAQLLLEEVFGHGEAQDPVTRSSSATSDQPFLPNKGIYWPKTNERPFHIVLFELDKKGRELLADRFFRAERPARGRAPPHHPGRPRRLREEAHRSDRQGAQTETLCVVSIVDDRSSTSADSSCASAPRAPDQRARGLHAPRGGARLGSPARRGAPRPALQPSLREARERRQVAGRLHHRPGAQEDQGAPRRPARNPDLLATPKRSCARSCATSSTRSRARSASGPKSANQNRRLDMVELPSNHGIGADPVESQKPGFKNPLQGVRIYDRDDRLLGFIVYVASTKAKVEPLRQALARPTTTSTTSSSSTPTAPSRTRALAGRTPLRGRLTRGNAPQRVRRRGRRRAAPVALLRRQQERHREAQAARHRAGVARPAPEGARRRGAREGDRGGNDKGPLKKLFDTFNAALATLTVEKFADAYAQTITYGMLAARWISSDDEQAAVHAQEPEGPAPRDERVPEATCSTSWSTPTSTRTSRGCSTTSRACSRAPASRRSSRTRSATRRSTSTRTSSTPTTRRCARTRASTTRPTRWSRTSCGPRTPRCRHDFGLPLGLADTTTWAAFAKAKKLAVPEGVDPKAPFVQVLDPALGTGTFLLRVIEVIHETMQAEFKKQGLDDEAARRRG
jgi:hypothetical protein